MSARDIINSAREKNRSLLEPEAYALLAAYDIPVLDYRLATSSEEARKMAGEVDFPVVMKVVSPDIIHKSDSGGVKLNISDEESAGRAFEDILENVSEAVPKAAIEGVLIAPMVTGGIEVIMGMVRDPQFGPAVMFGLGGIFVEVLKDVVFEIAPVSREEAESMIKSIKGYPLLAGARGSRPCHIESLIDIVTGISRLSLELPEIEEIDLNPVLATPERSFVLDARLLL
ncbi:MAG: acetate--CoA ligase family protein [Candidatus Euphemobacter frigidus]|nr:acetate--CoA ligase family protein [Candidatus Euphemobacter frigidus]MDP8275978.1 acetate--CoA ligase family protein [Candidatus Euphemobacter frigidus]